MVEYLMIALICQHLNGCELVTGRFASVDACDERAAELRVDEEHYDCIPVAAVGDG
jgi:hypothetical protein